MKRSYSVSVSVLILGVSLFLASCRQDKATIITYEKTGDEIIDALSLQIEKAPMVPDHYYSRAQALYERENYALAIDDLNKAIEIDSLNPNYYHLLADSYMDYYRSREALQTMRDVLKIYPNRVASLLKLAEFEYIVERHDVSIYNCNLIIKDHPNHPEAYFMLGLNFRALGDIDKAINSFQTAVESDPELIDAWLMLGDLHGEKGNAKATDYYDSAILLAPDKPEPKHSKAYYLQNIGRVSEAIALYRDIITTDPSYGMAFLNSGILYLEQDSLDKAYEQFNILAGLEPTNANAFFYRAQVAYLKGDLQSAQKDLQNTLNLNADDEQAQQLLAEINKEIQG